MCEFWNLLDHIETLTKVLAFSGAAGFFAWKGLTGWFITNLSLSLEAPRVRQSEEDLIAVKLLLSKGTSDAVYLDQAVLRVTNLITQAKSYYPLDISRLVTRENSSSKKYEVEWDAIDKRRSCLAPGEAMQLGELIRVPKNNSVLIEAVVVGGRRFWRGYEWRSSIVVNPAEN